MSEKLNDQMLKFVHEVNSALKDKEDLSVWEKVILMESTDILTEVNLNSAGYSVKDKNVLYVDQIEKDWGEEFAKCVRNPAYFFSNYVVVKEKK